LSTYLPIIITNMSLIIIVIIIMQRLPVETPLQAAHLQVLYGRQ
jgi:hypothetical protein